MKNNILKKLLSLKSIITLLLILCLIILVLFFTFKTQALDEKLFLLFSNIVSMVITYYFTKKSNEKE